MKIDIAGSEDSASDFDLLQSVARGELAPESARAAQATFYARHVRFLYGALLRRKSDLLSLTGQTAEDLVQDTFHRAFTRAHTFEADPSLERGRSEQRTRAWLGRIAENLLRDALSQRREVSASPFIERVVMEERDSQPPSERNPRLRAVSDGLEQLSDRERDVLRVTALFYRAGEHQRLPNDVSAELASRWGTTNDNIRAIRVRAMKKLKAFLQSGQAGAEETP